MNLETYFERPDAPAKNSPVGRLMVKILDKNPGMSFDDVRAEANRLLQRAAKAKNYHQPRVLSSEEQEAEKVQFRAWRGGRGKSGAR